MWPSSLEGGKPIILKSMKVVVAGGTGLTGRSLLALLEADDAFTEVIALTRREQHSEGKIRWVSIDFNRKSDYLKAVADADVVFCCLGTTMKKAGSKNAFIEVDYTYVIQLAEAAKFQGVRQFSAMSAMGADEKSRVFYNHVKGRMENRLRALRFRELIIFRPSLLLGPRQENRPGEKAGIVLAKLFSPLLRGPLAAYHPVNVGDIARAMIRESKIIREREEILTYRKIKP